MLCLLADENFNHHILRGLRRRYSDLDCIAVQNTEMAGAPDSAILEWAARHQRILLSHDFNTMLNFAYERIAAGAPMSGLIAISDRLPIGNVIASLGMLIECSNQEDFQDFVLHLPF